MRTKVNTHVVENVSFYRLTIVPHRSHWKSISSCPNI